MRDAASSFCAYGVRSVTCTTTVGLMVTCLRNRRERCANIPRHTVRARRECDAARRIRREQRLVDVALPAVFVRVFVVVVALPPPATARRRRRRGAARGGDRVTWGGAGDKGVDTGDGTQNT